MTRGPAKTPKKPTYRSNLSGLLDNSIKQELDWAGGREFGGGGESRAVKKNYAELLSRALAQRFADALRGDFIGILPHPDGTGQESKARTGKGLKKLDVNYSTVELGLGLGVSIKTINFRDAKTARYTKNYTRVDNELRAEAADYHERQPYAVMVGVIFIPLDACDDGGKSASSFGQAVRLFRGRAGRVDPTDDATLFEKLIIGLYDTEAETFGRTCFFDVDQPPPRVGRPARWLEFRECVSLIVSTYDARNKPSFKWDDGETDDSSPSGEDGE